MSEKERDRFPPPISIFLYLKSFKEAMPLKKVFFMFPETSPRSTKEPSSGIPAFFKAERFLKDNGVDEIRRLASPSGPISPSTVILSPSLKASHLSIKSLPL